MAPTCSEGCVAAAAGCWFCCAACESRGLQAPTDCTQMTVKSDSEMARKRTIQISPFNTSVQPGLSLPDRLDLLSNAVAIRCIGGKLQIPIELGDRIRRVPKACQ